MKKTKQPLEDLVDKEYEMRGFEYDKEKEDDT